MLFSVIVPIYNIEKYIKKCIDSVLSQTFTDFELILVDDGSPDACPAICDEYAKSDSRIKVIHKPNGGLVSARQAGISEAVGEYVFHLDGDDFITVDALESAGKIIDETHADIVSFAYRRYKDGVEGSIVYDVADEGLYTKERIESDLFPRILCDENMEHISFYLWGKAIRRELATKHQMRVSRSISLGEDVCCMLPCYTDADSIYISKKSIYLYTERNDSLSQDFKTHQITQIANVINEIRGLNMDKPCDLDMQISRYSCFMCFAILALAADGGYRSAAFGIKELVLGSLHAEEIRKASFKRVSKKSRIAIYLMKKQNYILAYDFLRLCKKIKDLI